MPISHAGRSKAALRRSFNDFYEALARSEEASDEPVYVISVAAELVGVHAQTLRHYERVGLVVPARTDGNIRLYSERDVARLTAIVRLTGEMGINLAGVVAILAMRRRLAELQREVEALESELRRWRGYLLEDSRRSPTTAQSGNVERS